jgi:hypothetical protein
MVTRIGGRFESWGGRYVWHPLPEHQDNETMRPSGVIPAP